MGHRYEFDDAHDGDLPPPHPLRNLAGRLPRLCNEQLAHPGASEITIRWTSIASPRHARVALSLAVPADERTAQATILLS